jgi:hypothetical protein
MHHQLSACRHSRITRDHSLPFTPPIPCFPLKTLGTSVAYLDRPKFSRENHSGGHETWYSCPGCAARDGKRSKSMAGRRVCWCGRGRCRCLVCSLWVQRMERCGFSTSRSDCEKMGRLESVDVCVGSFLLGEFRDGSYRLLCDHLSASIMRVILRYTLLSILCSSLVGHPRC